MDKIDWAKYEDDSTEKCQSEISSVSNASPVIEYDDVDDEGNETAAKEVVRLFREPDTRRYISKYAYIKIKAYEEDPKNKEADKTFQVGSIAKLDISKYVNTKEEPVSFMFRPTQAQLSENKNLPAVVKLDGLITVRLTTSELTSAKRFDDDNDDRHMAEEVLKQQTLAAQ